MTRPPNADEKMILNLSAATQCLARYIIDCNPGLDKAIAEFIEQVDKDTERWIEGKRKEGVAP